MEQVVQQNASLVEEATAATESMKEQAGSLLQMVSRLKLGTDMAAAATQHVVPRQQSTAAPAPLPISVKPRVTVPSGFAAALGAPAGKRNGNGEWKEFHGWSRGRSAVDLDQARFATPGEQHRLQHESGNAADSH